MLENQSNFPGFKANNKILGLVQSFLSTVPEQYQWAVSLMGLKGDLEEGLELLRSFAYEKDLSPEFQNIQKEAGYFYAYTLLHVAKQNDEAWTIIRQFTSDYRENMLSVFFRSTIAEKTQHNEDVIEVLESRPQASSYMRFHYLDFLLGEAKLNRLDKDADVPLLRFIEQYKGSNYIKSGLQKLSWHYLVHGDRTKYLLYKEQISKKGSAVNEDDKLADLYVSKPDPNLKLLKTRLLFDGGYLDKAFAIIHPMKSKELISDRERAEYAYRKARVYQSKGFDDFAMRFFEFASVYGKESDEYYGAYSCLYLADHALKEGRKSDARRWYSQALTYRSNKEYKSSIEQRAKQGLKNAE